MRHTRLQLIEKIPCGNALGNGIRTDPFLVAGIDVPCSLVSHLRHINSERIRMGKNEKQHLRTDNGRRYMKRESTVMVWSAALAALLLSGAGYAWGAKVQAAEGRVVRGTKVGTVTDPGHAVVVLSWVPSASGNSYRDAKDLSPLGYDSSALDPTVSYPSRAFSAKVGTVAVSGCDGKVVQERDLGNEAGTRAVTVACDDGSFIAYYGIGK